MRLGATVALALVGGLLAIAAPAQQKPPWSGFETILWWNDGIEPSERLLQAVGRLGFTAISVSSEQDPAVPGRHGLRFYRDQIAGKGVLELRDGPWSARVEAYEKSRNPADLVRPSCLSSEPVLAEVRATLRRRLAAALPHRPVAISLGDEISTTRHANPLDFCFSEDCLRGFRRFVLARYEGLVPLNGAWGSGFVSVDSIVPFTADRIRARELVSSTLPRNLRPWSEHLEFVDTNFAEVVASLRDEVAAAAPDVPCGLTGMQPPSAYGGHDYRRLMPLLGFYEAYDIGGARDLAMSLARPDAVQIATVMPPADGVPLQHVRARVFDMVAHGMGGLVTWSAQQVLADDGTPTAYGTELGRTFEVLREAADVTAGATLQRSPVWILESQASVRAHWMLDSIDDGRTWIRRLSSYERSHSTSLAARQSWIRLFEDLGMQPRLVPVEDLATQLAEASPRLLVLPALLSVSDAAARAIEQYVDGGGVALADHGLGLYDEWLQRREAGVLDDLFGVRGRSFDRSRFLVSQGVPDASGRLASGAAVAEVGLHGPLAEPAGGHQVHIENRHGRGRTVYLNLAICEYRRVRLQADRVATAVDLRRRVRVIAHDAGVLPVASVQGRGLPTCIERMELLTRSGRRVIGVRINALDNTELMATLAARGPTKMQLVLPREVHLRDLISGRDLGTAARFDLVLGPWVGLLLEVLP